MSSDNVNEPLDADDVEAHGLLGNAAIAAALTVGGSIAMASPAFANDGVVASDQATCEAIGGVWTHDARYVHAGYCTYREIGDQNSDPNDPYGEAYNCACGESGYRLAREVFEHLTDAYGVRPIPPEELQAVIFTVVPTALTEARAAQPIAEFLWTSAPYKIMATAGL